MTCLLSPRHYAVPLAPEERLPEEVLLEQAVPQLLRSWRFSPAQCRAARPPLSDLLQLTTLGAQNAALRAGICTAYGPRVSNEDSSLGFEVESIALRFICCADYTSKSSLFAVCDGHGGAAVSERLPELLRRSLLKAESAAEVEKAFVEVDEALKDERCGSTCALCLVWPCDGAYRLLVANLGDSRVVLHRARGEWQQIVESVDHKPDLPIEKKRIRAAGHVFELENLEFMKGSGH